MNLIASKNYLQDLQNMIVSFDSPFKKLEGNDWQKQQILTREASFYGKNVIFTLWNELVKQVPTLEKGKLYKVWYQIESKFYAGSWQTFVVAKKILPVEQTHKIETNEESEEVVLQEENQPLSSPIQIFDELKTFQQEILNLVDSKLKEFKESLFLTSNNI